jgi:hypothetical protein
MPHQHAQTVRPSRFVRQHHPPGGIERLGQIEDAAGRIASPFRIVDGIEMMVDRGTITGEQAIAALAFNELFYRAHLDTLQAPDIGRVPLSTAAWQTLPVNEKARRMVYGLIDQLGGSGSLGASLAWDVLGLGYSLREWAGRGGWNGRFTHYHAAVAVLMTVLCILDHEHQRQSFGAG